MGKRIEVTDELLKLVSEKKSAREISSILGINYTTVHRKLRKLGINLPNYHNELKFDNSVFDCIDSEEKAYWLGFLYADGYVCGTNNGVELSLKGEDKVHLEKFRQFLNCRIDVKMGKVTCNRKTFSRCRLYLRDKHFHDKLIELGCVPNKSLILKFPNHNIFSNNNLIIDFIRGYIDGDGCLSYTSTGRLSVQIIGTNEFLDGIMNIFPDIFHKGKKDYKHPNSNTYTITCSCDKADKLTDTLYKNATVFLDRKYNRYKKFSRYE